MSTRPNIIAISCLLLVGLLALSIPKIWISDNRPSEPEFFANLSDNNHCLQAAAMIVLHSLGHNVPWNEVISETQYEAGLYTWTIAGAVAISKYIPGTQFYSQFDYKAFADEGKDYLDKFWAQPYLQLQRKHASPHFKKEQGLAKSLLGSVSLDPHRLPKTDMMERLKD
jgi:hypothetical protein